MKKRTPRALPELVTKCRQGDNQAWHELIDLVAPVIFAICRKSRLSRDESFDTFGQVCLDLVKTMETVREPEKLPSLVAVITRRHIYKQFQKSRLMEYLDEEVMHELADAAAVDPERAAQEAQKGEILLEAVLSLPERDCRLIRALFLDPKEPSYEEIARELKMPVSSIGPTRAKALAKLQKLLRSKKDHF